MAIPPHKLTVFHEVYTPEVSEAIAERAKVDLGLKQLDSRLHPTNEYLAYDRVHLDKCLVFAKNCEGLDQDRLSRLRQPQNFHTWQSAYNELLVPYFFARAFRLQIEFVTNPQKKGLGDFQVIHQQGRIIVEVKTPKGDDPDLQGPGDNVHAGFDDELLRPAFIDGAKQLRRGNRNLIVICTQLCAWIHDSDAFEKLFYGQEVITRSFDSELGEAVGPTEIKFDPDGELLRHRPKRYTRISAIASFRNDISSCRRFPEEAQQIQFTVFHNYHAVSQIEPNMFAGVEQFIPDTGKHINKDKSDFLIEV